MRAIWGDPYTGGNGGRSPPKGVPWGLGPTPKGGWCDPGTAHALRDEQGVHRPTVLGPPMGGARWHPPSIGGGGRFVASLLVNLLVSLANVLVII